MASFVPSFSGPSGESAQYGQVSYMGIGVTENTEEAKQFVEYWLSDGYIPWLAVAPEGKFPMRRGTQDEPTKYLEEWAALEVGVDRTAPLSDFYAPADYRLHLARVHAARALASLVPYGSAPVS